MASKKPPNADPFGQFSWECGRGTSGDTAVSAASLTVRRRMLATDCAAFAAVGSRDSCAESSGAKTAVFLSVSGRTGTREAVRRCEGGAAMNIENVPVRSHAENNRYLVSRFEVYLQSRNRSENTRRKYLESLNQLVAFLGSRSVVDLDRPTIRQLMTIWYGKGLHPNSVRLHIGAFRSFFKYLRVTGLAHHDPTFVISHPKVPKRVPIVLTIEQVKSLINAARDPFELAVVEVMYATGCRVSELCNLRTDDIMCSDSDGPSTIRIKNGKGGKDRRVYFGTAAARAIHEYQKWRPSKHGYLFEAPPRTGVIYQQPSKKAGKKGYWYLRVYLNRVQREFSLGRIEDLPTEADVHAALGRFLRHRSDYHPLPSRPYKPDAIWRLLNRLAERAGIPHVHPHALRRAFASHLLQSGGDLRAVQELLGHTNLSTTMRYTVLEAGDLRKVYEKAHPHAKGNTDDKE